MEKRILLLIMFLLPMLANAADIVIDGIYYNILSEIDNTVEVTYENSPSIGFYSGNIIIPEKVEYGNKTYTVTSIGYGAFCNCWSLENIKVPNTITHIKAWAFRMCSKITEITIPKSVVSIGYSAFEGCYGLNKLTIEDSNEKLNFEIANAYSLEYAFDNVPLNSIYLGRDISYSLRSPFFRNDKINSVTIGEKATTINEAMFIGCKNIQKLLIPSNINYIGNKAFSECTGLKTLILEDGIRDLVISSNPNNWGPFYWCSIDSLYLGRNVIADVGKNTSDIFRGTSINTIFIGAGLNTIPDRLFIYCEELKKVYLNSGLKKIASQTFSGFLIRDVYSLSMCVIPIEKDAFYNLSSDSAVLHVPYVALPFYKSDNGWSIFNKIESIEKTYTLSYYINGELYLSYDLLEGMAIPIPEQEGYTFSSWSEIPETMPAEDVVVTGSFKINKYLLTYKVDNEVFKSDSIVYNSALTAIEAPTKEGYTFSGWSEIPETMPAEDVIVTGTFKINKYLLTYKVDDEVFKSDSIVYNTAITPEANPTKEGYTFSGWSEIPETMPAKDVLVTGTFSINSYKLTYMIDDKVYKDTIYEYSATIIPEPMPEGNYATFEWTGLPETMPAHDVVVHASYTTGIREMILAKPQDVQIYSPNGKKLNKPQKGLNIVKMRDGTIRKIVIK